MPTELTRNEFLEKIIDSCLWYVLDIDGPGGVLLLVLHVNEPAEEFLSPRLDSMSYEERLGFIYAIWDLAGYP